MLLKGKKALIMGVANKRSIAWGIATSFHREGCELAFTYQNERLRGNVAELVAELPGAESIPLLPCDVASDEQITAVFDTLAERWGHLHILVHSLAYAEREDLSRGFAEISRRGFAVALDISAYSLIPVARGAKPLMEKAGGGSIITLTYNAVERVVPSYNVMAIAKAALECEVRYLAAELGPSNVRVNAISAGPLKTLAASAVRGLSRFRDLIEEKAPLRRNITQEEVGDVAAFLASDLARAVTGNTIFVDSGFHLMALAE